MKALKYPINKLASYTRICNYSMPLFSGINRLTVLSLTMWSVWCEAKFPWAELPGTCASSSMPVLCLSLLCLLKARRIWQTEYPWAQVPGSIRLSRHCHLHSETCQRSLEANLVDVALCQSICSGIMRSRFRVLSRRDRPEPTPQACSLSTSPGFRGPKVHLILTTSEVSSQTEQLKTRTKACSICIPHL